jgi:hypothetical protein
MINELLSPITLLSTIFNVMYACFWINYTLLILYEEFRWTYILGVLTICRMLTLFYITADVNTQVGGYVLNPKRL